MLVITTSVIMKEIARIAAEPVRIAANRVEALFLLQLVSLNTHLESSSSSQEIAKITIDPMVTMATMISNTEKRNSFRENLVIVCKWLILSYVR